MDKVVAVFTNSLRYEAVPELRLFGPLSLAGYKVIYGNELLGPDKKIDLRGVDIVTIQRDFPRYWSAYNDLMIEARRANIPVIYDIDDLLWELPVEHPDRRNSSYAEALLPMISAAVAADMITVSTPALITTVKPFNSNVSLLPNYLNDTIWNFKQPKYQSDSKSPVVIGYMGSYTHDPDIKMILPALTRLLKEYDKNLIIRFLGQNIPVELRQFQNVEARETWCASYSEFATILSNWSCDIGIAPLIASPFNRSKSPIKFFEYSCIGMAGVYSNIDPYKWVITNGLSGFLAATQEEWYSFLKQLIDEPKLRYDMALAAQKTVQEKWSLSSHANEWKEIYEKIRPVSNIDAKNTIYGPRALTNVTEQVQNLINDLKNREQALMVQVAEKNQLQVQLSSVNFILQQKVNSLYQSKSWRFTQPFRHMMDFFQKIKLRFHHVTPQAKRIRTVLHQNPAKPDVRLDQFHFMIESSDVNYGLVAMNGWAFHEKWHIEQVNLIVSNPLGNNSSTVFTYKKERMDVFQEFPVENALRSGFYGEVELPNEKHHLSLVFILENEIQIIVDFNTPEKKYFGGGNLTVNPVYWFNAMIKLATMPMMKKVLAYFMRGDFKYIKERIGFLLREYPKNEPRKKNLELAHCAQFFNAKKNIDQQNALEQEIDIIIPVYNGMQYLVRLFDCLFKNTNTPFRVIVVDDHSPDPNVAPFLDELARQNPNILLLRNHENKGFVKTINYAAGFARNHFVVLNTDVEVPKGWLQRLMKPILNGSNVASTTPFTNAGTICSFPVPLVDNPIFGNLDLDIIDSVFQQLNTSAISIELPTGVGFCMGINLAAWSQIGSFDEDRFGRGYGEENDWCMRASLAGYQNLMAPDLFVYHKHGGSFSTEEKQKLVHKNLQKLYGLYPNYQGLVEKFIRADPPEPIRKFASLCLMGIASSEKPLLIIDHEIGGGANAYRRQLIEDRLQAGQAVLLLTYDTLQRSIKLQASYQDYEEIFYISRVDDLFILPKYLPIGEIFYNNLVGFAESLEMVNDIGHLQQITAAKLTIALHDYYPLCTSYTLLDHTGRYCDLPSIETCKMCLPRNPYRNQNDPHDIVKWRQAWSSLLEKADEVICFSESSAKLLMRVYNLVREHISVQPHKLLTQFSRKPKIDIHTPLNIGIVGALNYAKGAQMVVDVAKIFARHDPSVKITVIGILHGVFQPPNVTVTGKYDIFRLPDILEQYKVNLCFFPSVWPETYSYVTSELMQLEMPVCCFNLGAPAERIASYEFGRLIDEVNASVAADVLIKFHEQLKQSSELRMNQPER